MKNVIFYFKQKISNFLMIGGALLFSIGVWGQSVLVDVPQKCEVVVAGNGGTIGFGGKVGDGGVVVMPDPYNNAGDFTIIPSGATIDEWRLLGDLSFEKVPLPINQSITSPTSPEKIYSYNKNVRESESITPSADRLARSKGRVYVLYDASSCSGRMEFEVYKKYSNTSGMNDEYVPPIIGSECWLPDSTYTYSVDQIASDNLEDGIGVDMYYWTIEDKDGNLIYDSESSPKHYPNSYTSKDKSSIITKAPQNLNAPYTITCCFGRANGWDGNGSATHTTCVQFSVGVQLSQPDANSSTCLPVSANSYRASPTPEKLSLKNQKSK